MVGEQHPDRRIDDRQLVVGHVVGDEQVGVDELLPPASIDRGAEAALDRRLHRGTEDVAALRDHGDVVRVAGIGRTRAEAFDVGRLQHHLDRSAGARAQLVGEAGRRHEHEVGVVALAFADVLGMADHPQHVGLAR